MSSSSTKKIYEFIGKTPLEDNPDKDTKELLSKSFIGVEVELEHASGMAQQRLPSWSTKPDGSLRDDGMEFVFRRPKQGTDALKAFEELEEAAKQRPPKSTVYCSTHVHMNFLSSTIMEVLNFVSLYMLVEDALARYCGPDRENNMFCLTVSNAEEQLDMYQELMRTQDINAISKRGEGRVKYSALNLYTLVRFGTVECRLAKGMYTKQELVDWVNLLMCIRRYALRMDTPMDTLIQMSRMGTNDFMKDIFGKYYELLQPHFRDDEIHQGVDRVQFMLSI